MAEILPFKGLRYNPEKIKDISKVITPPYDVISEKERDDYYQLHPENIIRLILSKDLPGDDQSNNKYTRSAEFFDTWKKEEILKAVEIRQDSYFEPEEVHSEETILSESWEHPDEAVVCE